MKCFRIDFNKLLRITLLNKESFVPPREHRTRYTSEYILYAVTKGVLKLKVNGTETELMTGDICLFDKGDFQESAEPTCCEYYYIHFATESIETFELTEEQYRKEISEKKKKCNTLNFTGSECYENCYVLLKQKYTVADKVIWEYFTGVLEKNKLNFESRYPGRRMEISNAICLMFFKLEELGEENHKTVYYTVRKIVDYIEKNFAQPVSGRDIERIFFLSYDYANRMFEEQMNSSIIKYRNFVRINHAKNMLSATDLPLAEISEQTGFENQQYFSRIFKKFEGITPSGYRRKMRSMETDADK